MFLFTYDCLLDENGPLVGEAEFAGIGGAYVNIYINFVDLEGALALSRFYVEREGWIITEKEPGGESEGESEADEEESFIAQIEREDVTGDESEEFFNEAEEYGYSLVCHLWPKDAPDADESAA